MGHNLLNNDRFVAARNMPGWHHLGTVLPADQDVTVADAIAIGKIDFPYVVVPLTYMRPDSTEIIKSGQNMVLRPPIEGSDKWVELGAIKEHHTVFQNIELAQGLDALAKRTGWKFETVGALGEGETVFLTLRTGQRSIFGDKWDTYLIVSDGKANNRALQIVAADTRVVCENTLVMSDASNFGKISISHDHLARAEFDFWLNMLGDMQAAQDEVWERVEQLAQVKITNDEAKAIFERAYPMPKRSNERQMLDTLSSLNLSPLNRERIEQKLEVRDPYEVQAAYATNHRAAAFELYTRFNAGGEVGAIGGRLEPNVDLAKLVKTPYAALNAVTELVDYGARGLSIKQAARSATFGTGAEVKGRAFDAALAAATN